MKENILIKCNCGHVVKVPIDTYLYYEQTGRPKELGSTICPLCGKETTAWLTISCTEK